MTGAATANWLMVVGLAYAGIGMALVAATAIATTQLAGTANAAGRSATTGLGSRIAFATVIMLAGFFMQAVAQFTSMPLGGAVAALLLALIGLLTAMALGEMSSTGASSGDAPSADRVATPTASVIDVLPPGLPVGGVKLVSTG